jgi:hypothetical protein
VGDGIAHPDAGAKPFSEHDQDLVASGVAKAIVDPFEIVEIHEENHHRVIGRATA